jgi:hypothetical protein
MEVTELIELTEVTIYGYSMYMERKRKAKLYKGK